MSIIRDNQMKEYAQMFKALSNPNRLKIFLRLSSMCSTPVDADELACGPGLKGCSCVGDIHQYTRRRTCNIPY